MPDHTAKPAPRLCPWCTSTNTFAARRCIFCGMDLGAELARATPVSPAVATPSPSLTQRWGLALGMPIGLVVLALILLLHAHWL